MREELARHYLKFKAMDGTTHLVPIESGAHINLQEFIRKSCPKSDPNTARTIILSTYPTWVSRTLENKSNIDANGHPIKWLGLTSYRHALVSLGPSLLQDNFSSTNLEVRVSFAQTMCKTHRTMLRLLRGTLLYDSTQKNAKSPRLRRTPDQKQQQMKRLRNHRGPSRYRDTACSKSECGKSILVTRHPAKVGGSSRISTSSIAC